MRFPYHGAGFLLYRIKDSRLQVLLGKRAKKPFEGLYCIPGGFRESGETDTVCAIRELYEETSVRIKELEVEKRLFSLRFPFFSWTTFIRCLDDDCDLVPSEFSDLRWFDIEDAMRLHKRPFSNIELRMLLRKMKGLSHK